MILIANRGNLYGRNRGSENNPEYLNEAIVQGYHVLIDTWYVDGCFWFGTDQPIYKPIGGGEDWLLYSLNSVWLRAKNPEALVEANRLGLNVFWQQTDLYALTTWGQLLCFYESPSAGQEWVAVPSHTDYLLNSQTLESFLPTVEGAFALCCDHVGTISQTLMAADAPGSLSISQVA
jgi:hypothetical protein